MDPSKKPSSRAVSLDSHGGDELESDPIVINQQDARSWMPWRRSFLKGAHLFLKKDDTRINPTEPFPSAKNEYNPPSESMRKTSHGALPSSENDENDPPSDLPVASDSDTPLVAPRTPIKGRAHLQGLMSPIRGRARRTGPKGTRSISDTFRTMGNQSPILNAKGSKSASEPVSDWPESGLPPSDPPVMSDEDTPLAGPRTPILDRLCRKYSPTKNAPLFMQKVLERRKDLDNVPTIPAPQPVPKPINILTVSTVAYVMLKVPDKTSRIYSPQKLKMQRKRL